MISTTEFTEYVLTALHIGLFLIVSLRVVSRSLYPSTSLAWMLLVILLPVIGFTIYILVGERPLGRLRLRRIRLIGAPFRHWLEYLPPIVRSRSKDLLPGQTQIANLAMAVSDMPLLRYDHIDVAEGASAILRSIARDIDAARQSCYMAFYIWNAGGQADEVAEAFERAARRGVRCRLLLDAVGSRSFLHSDWIRRFRTAGIKVEAALPVGPIRTLFARADLRLHRKIVVIDGRCGYTGSMNLVDPRYFKTRAGVGEWIDAMLRFEGPPVAAMQQIFLADWATETGEIPAPTDGRTIDEGWRVLGPAAAVVVPSGPDRPSDAIRRLVLGAIYEARRELVITTPYFVPDEAVLIALESAALRGVEVTLIVPERVDSRLVRHASRSFFDSLMVAGVRICQFRGGLLHTKSLTVDGETTLFGTFNLDIRSLRLNFEVTVVAFDTRLASEVRGLQKSYQRNSTAVDLAEWRRRPIARRFLENIVRLASPLL